MEDRHSISEPRAVARSPTVVEWEVDILRDETVVVDTFILNDEVLPPRTNKKGKVLWRLPDSEDKLPSFAVEDRRRILDIFKDRKKKRKQEKKKRQEDGIPDSGGETPPNLSRNNSLSRENSTSYSHDELVDGSAGVAGKENGHIPGPYEWYRNNNSDPENLSKEQVVPVKKIKDKEVKQTNNSKIEEKKSSTVSEASTNGYRRQQSCPAASRPPPGLGDVPEKRPSVGEGLLKNDPSLPLDPPFLSLNEEPQQNNRQHSSPSILETYQPGSSPMPALDALFIVVPHIERPDPLPGEDQPSLAVPAARHFIESYYSYLENTSPAIAINDLARYYTTKAQKSVSIGGAHSVVQGRKDITTQILSLAGSTFIVRGVVAQDTFDGRGVHILITGTAKTVCNAVAGGVLAFAHSLSLSRVDAGAMNQSNNLRQASPGLADAFDSGFPFQIHNDALAFLSGDTIPPPPPQPVPPAQHPPPPPGLF